eukprot:1207959-Prymnesium_polylepis.1
MRDEQIDRAIGELRGTSSVHKVLTAALDDVEAQFAAGVQQATGCAADAATRGGRAWRGGREAERRGVVARAAAAAWWWRAPWLPLAALGPSCRPTGTWPACA